MGLLPGKFLGEVWVRVGAPCAAAHGTLPSRLPRLLPHPAGAWINAAQETSKLEFRVRVLSDGVPVDLVVTRNV